MSPLIGVRYKRSMRILSRSNWKRRRKRSSMMRMAFPLEVKVTKLNGRRCCSMRTWGMKDHLMKKRRMMECLMTFSKMGQHISQTRIMKSTQVCKRNPIGRTGAHSLGLLSTYHQRCLISTAVGRSLICGPSASSSSSS